MRTVSSRIELGLSQTCIKFTAVVLHHVDHIDHETYMLDVENAEQFLRRASDRNSATPRKKMYAYSAKLEFENAAMVRNQMSALSKVLHQQSMEPVAMQISILLQW